MGRRLLLACGLIAPLFYIIANDVIAASLYPGYDRLTRPVSELSATYSPTRPLLVPLLLVFSFMMLGFWIQVWRDAAHNRALRTVAAFMLGFDVLGILAFPFPMVANEVLGANTIHTIIWGVITPVLMIASMSVSTLAYGPRFRLFAALMLVILVASSVWTGVLAGKIAAGETVGWFGFAERALQAPWLLWVSSIAWIQLRTQPLPISAPAQLRSSPAQSPR